MKVTVSIDGREALPARAIPFVTGWQLSPDALAKDLAKHGHRARRDNGLRALQFDPDNQHPAITPGEWDQVTVRLDALDLGLRRTNGGMRDEFSYAAWRDQSPACLPKGCFVWQDEFEKAIHNRHTSAGQHEVNEMLTLNFSPLVPAELEAVLMEGFPSTPQRSEPVPTRAAGKWPWGDHDTKHLRALADAATKFWSLYDPADPTTAPKNEDVIAWLETKRVSNNIAKAIATILRADDLSTGPRK